MSENQIISFLEFVNQDDEDKYNMLVESAAIIRQKENIIKELREYLELIKHKQTGIGYYTKDIRRQMLKILEGSDKE